MKWNINAGCCTLDGKLISDQITELNPMFWNSLLTAGFGALLGSISAFAFQWWWSRREEKKKQLAAGHQAVFELLIAYNTLENYRQKVIDPYVDKPESWLRSPVEITATANPIHRGLEFLLPDAGELLLELAIESNRYQAAIDVVMERTRFMTEQLQPALERTGLQQANLDEIEERLGPLIVGGGKSRWHQVCRHVVKTNESLLPALEKLRAELKKHFPSEAFLTVAENSQNPRPRES